MTGAGSAALPPLSADRAAASASPLRLAGCTKSISDASIALAGDESFSSPGGRRVSYHSRGRSRFI
jgi:hypothetical protein